MQRRKFINGLLTGAAALTAAQAPLAMGGVKEKQFAEPPFRMKFSPDFNIFSSLPGKDVAGMGEYFSKKQACGGTETHHQNHAATGDGVRAICGHAYI